MQHYPSALPDTVLDLANLVLMHSPCHVCTMRAHTICPRAPDFYNNFSIPDLPGIDPDMLPSQEFFDILSHRGGGKLRFTRLNPTTSLVIHHIYYYRAQKTCILIFFL